MECPFLSKIELPKFKQISMQGGYNFSAFSSAWIVQTVLCLSFTAVLRVAGSLQKSTEVMKAMQNLVKIPEIQATMRDLSKEMMKVRSGTSIRPG